MKKLIITAILCAVYISSTAMAADISKNAACDLTNGRYTQSLEITTPKGYIGRSTNFLKVGDYIYYPVQVAKTEGYSKYEGLGAFCETPSYELNIYKYNCKTKKSVNLTKNKIWSKKNLMMFCDINIHYIKNNTIILQGIPYEWHSPDPIDIYKLHIGSKPFLKQLNIYKFKNNKELLTYTSKFNYGMGETEWYFGSYENIKNNTAKLNIYRSEKDTKYTKELKYIQKLIKSFKVDLRSEAIVK